MKLNCPTLHNHLDREVFKMLFCLRPLKSPSQLNFVFKWYALLLHKELICWAMMKQWTWKFWFIFAISTWHLKVFLYHQVYSSYKIMNSHIWLQCSIGKYRIKVTYTPFTQSKNYLCVYTGQNFSIQIAIKIMLLHVNGVLVVSVSASYGRSWVHKARSCQRSS